MATSVVVESVAAVVNTRDDIIMLLVQRRCVSVVAVAVVVIVVIVVKWSFARRRYQGNQRRATGNSLQRRNLPMARVGTEQCQETGWQLA